VKRGWKLKLPLQNGAPVILYHQRERNPMSSLGQEIFEFIKDMIPEGTIVTLEDIQNQFKGYAENSCKTAWYTQKKLLKYDGIILI
jgi:hypothetical protein